MMAANMRWQPADGSAAAWGLNSSISFLNHGSCGACPRPVLEAQQAWRDQMEAEPIDFLGRELPALMDASRVALAGFVGADADDLAFVPNATAGVSTVLRSVRFERGDELLATSLEYNASLNALRYAAERDAASVVIAAIPFPVSDPEQVINAVLDAVTSRTRLALISHITSPTAVVLPIAELVETLAARGIDTLVDGAHAPGMVPVDIESIGAAYYTGNGHKWLSAPKGSAFLHVRRDRQHQIRPLAIGHGANDPRTDRSRFRLEFDVMATQDPTPYLAVGTAVQFMETLAGGWPALMRANRALALGARDHLCGVLNVQPIVPAEMMGSMALIPLGSAGGGLEPGTGARVHERLFHEYRIEVPVYEVPAAPRQENGRPITFVRISAQQYNSMEQYERLGTALGEILER